MPASSSATRPVLGVARLRDRVGVRGAELQVGGGEREREHDRHAGAGGEPAAARDGLGPARPGAAGLVVGAPVRPVEPVADLGQHDRQQRDRDQRRDERDQHPAVAHRAQERQRQRDQREQADRDRDAAEDDRAAGGLHRPLHGLVAAAPVRALLAPARDDDQRVVDRHAEPDQRDQELHDRRDLGELGQPEQEQEGGHDRDDRHPERDEREQRGEDEGEHGQRADAADHRLEQDARAFAVGAAESSASASKPVRCTGCARDGGALERAARGLLGLAGSRRSASRDRAAGRRPRRRCARRRRRRCCRRSRRRRRSARRAAPRRGARRSAPARLRTPGESTVLPSGSVTTGSSGARVAAGAAVALGDRDVGLPALLVRDRELRLERVGGGPRGRDAGDREHDPGDDDGALVGEDPAGERGHGFECSPHRRPLGAASPRLGVRETEWSSLRQIGR